MKKALLFLAVLAACGSLAAQNDYDQNTACPGWNNPMDFMQGDGVNFYYSGQTGEKVNSSQCNNYPPSALTGVTGFTSVGAATGTWYNTPNVTNAQLQAGVTINGNYDHAAFPTTRIGGFPFPSVDQHIGYAIYDSLTTVGGSYAANRDPNTGSQLPYVPMHFNTHDTTPGVVNTNLVRSIRIGDAYGNHQATALYYNMKVNSQNAMLYIYYAAVIESPASSSSQTVHGKNCDPAFIIRVMKKNTAGEWIQANPVDPTSNVMDDRLTYMVSSTPHEGQGWSHQGSYGGFGSVDLGTDSPWHIYTGGTPSGTNGSFSSYKIFWKEWDKVALNLSPLYGQDVRIEVMVSDCCMTQHFAYAYLSGECRPMVIPTVHDSLTGTTLHAPRGFRNYVWEVSEFGMSYSISDLYSGGSNDYFTFRRLTPVNGPDSAGAYIYHTQPSDFHITKRRNASGAIVDIDSTGYQQTYRCKLTSSLDPDKSFVSYMYANVEALFSAQDTTPIIDTLIIHDTIIVHDTLYIDVPYAVHDTTYINVYVHDTTTVTDTLWLTQYDTVWMTHYDTIIIHDTVYLPNSIDGVEMVNAKIYANQGQIVVEGADGYPVALYDAIGREINVKRKVESGRISFTVPLTGVYLIKIGDLPARRIVVIK